MNPFETPETAERPAVARPRSAPWWRGRRTTLLQLMADGRPRFFYDRPTLQARARELRQRLPSVDQIYFSVKANRFRSLLKILQREGLGFECVSLPEVRMVRRTLGPRVPLLFTPNFCALDDYAQALALDAEVVVDGPAALLERPEAFAGREIGLRLDTGQGHGHHEKVRTAGPRAKFGHPIEELEPLRQAAAECGARVVGLHAHVGSGILDPAVWPATADALNRARASFPEVRWLDLGGGLGVPERPDQAPLDLDAIEAGLAPLRSKLDKIRLRLEPGRFLVSEAGVLVAHVTQVRRKQGVNYVGLSTGMNSLLRPALYGAWHGIHNLTRLHAPATENWEVVGPACESSDVLGHDRPLPEPRPGDVLLIENAGAYGAVMASNYNLLPPAEEYVLL